jgi:hypothetical protein
MFKAALAGLSALAVHLAFTAAAEAQSANTTINQARALAEQNRIRLPAKVLGYDPHTDTFTHQASAITATSSFRPGGDTNYYGNRLERFHFRGSEEQGGIYTAIRWHVQGLKIDPRNYQYRMGQQ